MNEPSRVSGTARCRTNRAVPLLLLLSVLVGALRAPAQTAPWPQEFIPLPAGFPEPPVPADNPLTPEKAALGRFLFFDRRLSGNQTQACASCHEPARAFTDGLVRPPGSTGEFHPRNSMSLANTAYGSALAWANPLLDSLEKQALVPLFGEEPVELGLAGRDGELLDRLRSDPRYARMFPEAFPGREDPFTIGNVVRALGSFQRTLISGNSPYDRYVQGLDDDALSDSAFEGGRLFFSERLECFHCHGGFNFTASVTHTGTPFDETAFLNTGLYNIDGRGAYPPDNTGLFEITGKPADMGRFKAPTLRNIALTAPYMHDGSIATLDEVIDHYAAGGRRIVSGPYAGDGSRSPLKNPLLIGFRLNAEERQQLLDFLHALTDEEFVTNPRLADPFPRWPCPGDCGYDREVTVNEIIVAVNQALGQAPLAACLTADGDGDGEVQVNEIVAAVNSSLAGCGLAAGESR